MRLLPSLAAAALLLPLGCSEPFARPNRPLPELTGTYLDGRPLSRDDLLGRPFVINLWVPGCGPCVREFPGLERVRAEYEGRGVGFLALSLEPDQQQVREAVAKLGIGMTVATTKDEVLAPLGVRAVPSTVFVAADGTVVAAATGARDERFFAERVRELLGPDQTRGEAPEKEKPVVLHMGDRAPDFDLPSTTGKNVSLASLRGKKVVLYFYPKDQTPGCTQEACDFRDRHAALEGSGAVVLGVSKDSLASHGNFREKQSLPFPLLTDADNEVARAYGAYGEKTSFGKTSTGTIRSTFLIDEEGNIARIWSPVKVDGHAEEVLAAVRGEGTDATKIPPAGMATGVMAAQKARTN